MDAQFKIGFYDEFRQDWRAAVSNYRDAYDQLTASLNQFSGVERLEAKAEKKDAEVMMHSLETQSEYVKTED